MSQAKGIATSAIVAVGVVMILVFGPWLLRGLGVVVVLAGLGWRWWPRLVRRRSE